MDEKYNLERKQLAAQFEAAHSAFLEELRHMPTDKKEERWIFFDRYDRKENFDIELMEVYRPGAYYKIKERLVKFSVESFHADSNLALPWINEIDPVVFMEVRKKAIEIYTGTNQKGESYGFVACVGILYRQKADEASAENRLQRKGISDQEIPKRNLSRVFRLVRKAERVWEKSSRKISKEEALEQAVKEVSCNYTKKDMELVRTLFFPGSIVVSMDMPLGTEDGDTGDTLGTRQEDKEDYFESVLDREAGCFLLEAFCRGIEERWEVITSAKGLREQEFFKAFFTHWILRELKLDKSEKPWKPYLEEPAGDETFYQVLKPKGDFLYNRMFYKKYLWRAFIKRPEDFYSVYALLLRKDFEFIDKVLVEIMGKEKTVVSKKKKEYLKLMKDIYDYYRNS